MALFIMLYKVVPTFESLDEILLMVFTVYCRCKVVLTFESVDEILKCDHSNESY